MKLERRTGKKITFRVPDTQEAKDIRKIDDLVTIEVFEGYRKLGRFKLGDARLKFR